jgi:hypothetical protein
VAALSEYCYNYLSPIFEEQIESEHGSDVARHLGKDHVLNEITRVEFEKYFEAWKARQVDPETRQRISPYLV